MKKQTAFATKKEFFQYLIANKKELIEFKIATPKFTDPFGATALQAIAIKTLNTSYKDDVASGIITRTIIGNTYNWMDSHDDVHLDGVFSKSISESKDLIWHLHDHVQMITAKVGKPLSIYEKEVAWTDLGIDLPGKTTALFMDSNIMKDYNSLIFTQYLNKEINQHSVGMIYVDLDLAVNDADMKEEFSIWNKYINLLGNKEKAIKQGFFWAVKEAKLREMSCVLLGSNELTPTVENTSKTQKTTTGMYCKNPDCEDFDTYMEPGEDEKCKKCGGDMTLEKSAIQAPDFYTKLHAELRK